MKVESIRFSVGEKGNQYTQVWTLWNNKDDVYLTTKYLGQNFKYSLHASGVWVLAATSESGIEVSGNRRISRWTRPQEFRTGWTLGPHIVVPWTEWSEDILVNEGINKPIEWLPKPNKGQKATFAIIFANQKLTPKDLEQISESGDMYIEQYLELDNKEKVFIRVKYENLSLDDHKFIESMELQAPIWPTEQVGDIVGGFLMMFLQDQNLPFVYSTKFGQHHQSINKKK